MHYRIKNPWEVVIIFTPENLFSDSTRKSIIFNPAQVKNQKDILRELEDEFLANVGVDVFEEVFKLIYTKLFDRAKNKWQGIFTDDDKIKLTPSHLAICVSFLQCRFTILRRLVIISGD
ncbi:MAG: hypothetical protein IJQ85_08050 [Selenomonadaceae bacterium]|nr:hypothetical protein [Selenomonadaceae bacterium]